MLGDELGNLAAYADAAGVTDPLAQHLLACPVGALDGPLYLEGLYRIETAASIAWGIELAETIPPVEDPADYDTLRSLFPLTEAPAIARARRRDEAVVAAELAAWTARLAVARTTSDASPADESAGIQRSRAFERTRGLMWVSGDARYVEQTIVR
jgi:hypothetical protein